MCSHLLENHWVRATCHGIGMGSQYSFSLSPAWITTPQFWLWKSLVGFQCCTKNGWCLFLSLLVDKENTTPVLHFAISMIFNSAYIHTVQFPASPDLLYLKKSILKVKIGMLHSKMSVSWLWDPLVMPQVPLQLLPTIKHSAAQFKICTFGKKVFHNIQGAESEMEQHLQILRSCNSQLCINFSIPLCSDICLINARFERKYISKCINRKSCRNTYTKIKQFKLRYTIYLKAFMYVLQQ